jgi:two-component system LytT family response regulator
MATDAVYPGALAQSRFRALIADDQRSTREAISRVLEDDGSIDIVSECASGSEALAAIERHSPDMLFVDVQLPEVPGFQLVESSTGRVPAVVFVSALDQYAARAFDAQAADYIVKPFHDHRLQQAIERAKARVQMERSRLSMATPADSIAPPVTHAEGKYLERLALRHGDRIFFQKVQLVDCFTSEANYVRVHCGATTHRMRSTMNELERKLDPRQFVRIHRCTIINLESLRDFRPLPHGDYSVSLVNSTQVTMSRNYRQQFRQALAALSYTH